MIRFTLLSAFGILALYSCQSPKKSHATSVSSQSTSICNKKVRYVIEKIRMIEGGNEVKLHAEITIDPSLKNINLISNDPDNGNKTFDTQIESIDCAFNENLTKGQTTYKGYIKQDDGRKTWTSLTIEFQDDQLIIRTITEDRPSNIYMIIDRWEIVAN